MDEKNEELVDAQIVEEDSRMYGHAEGEPGGEVADEPALERQYRTAIDRVTVEIPAGKLDPGEDPLDCAKRELHEETGFKAGRIRFLTSIVTSCGFCDEIIHIYLATKLEFDAPNPDDDEFVNVDLVPLHELIDAVLDGKIEDAKTVVGALACDSIAHRLGGAEL